MKSWKALLGVGAACAACCAVPLLGGAAALTVGTTALAGIGSALLACADELLPLAGVLLGVAAIGGGVLLWRRRRSAQPLAQGATCGGGCHAGRN